MPTLPSGTYRARVKSFEQGFSKNEVPMVELLFECTEGPREGDTIRHWVYFASEENAKWSFLTLEDCGWDGVNEDALDGLGTKVVEIVVVSEEYGGKTRDRVKYVNNPDRPRGGAKALGEEGKATFASRLRAYRGKPEPQTSVKRTGTDDDPLPF